MDGRDFCKVGTEFEFAVYCLDEFLGSPSEISARAVRLIKNTPIPECENMSRRIN